MKKRGKILILALCCVLLFSTGVLAADSVTKTIEATYRDIKLVVDGIPVTPKDVNGNVVEPFIYNGTTYLPVRAVGEALGKTVGWDGATSTVYIGAIPGEDLYLLDVCPPYETNVYSAPDALRIMQKEYTKSFCMGFESKNLSQYSTPYALFNLNGQYDTLSFDVGPVDGSGNQPTGCKVYLDGEYYATIDLTRDMLLTHYEIPLNGALQLKLQMTTQPSTNPGSYGYGFVNVIVE